MGAASLFLPIARREVWVCGQAKDHHAALDVLSREIRRFTAAMFRPDTSPRETDLLASLKEEEDLTASLGETLFQVARRVERQPFSPTSVASTRSLPRGTDYSSGGNNRA